MLITLIGLLRFGFSLIFGISVSVLFSGVEINRSNRWAITLLCIIFLGVQTLSWWLVGIETTSKLYPLITHVPLVIIFRFYFKRPWLNAVVSVLSGYLCCQAPRWFGFLAGAVTNNILADHLVYIVAIIVFYLILKKYIIASVRELMEMSTRSYIFLGGVPLFYYCFDYVTVVYTDALYRGAKWAVQFMPSTISIFYFVFVVLYYMETQKQAKLQRERDMLDAQFRLAQSEFQSLKALQENAAAYRHDMRHHFSLLQALAANQRLEDILAYLNAAQSDMDAITPQRYCDNETVNLILTAYANKAKEANIQMTIDAKLPDRLAFSDTELCSLLSNALENAIHASSELSQPADRLIHLRLYEKNSKLCIDLRNRCLLVPQWRDGMPQSFKTGHGFGTKSMTHIVEKHGGVYQFSYKNDWFIFQASA